METNVRRRDGGEEKREKAAQNRLLELWVMSIGTLRCLPTPPTRSVCLPACLPNCLPACQPASQPATHTRSTVSDRLHPHSIGQIVGRMKRRTRRRILRSSKSQWRLLEPYRQAEFRQPQLGGSHGAWAHRPKWPPSHWSDTLSGMTVSSQR